MSKLRKQLKVLAKRKVHRANVQRRKEERLARGSEAEKEAAQEKKIEAEVNELLRKEAAQSAEGTFTEDEKRMIGGLLVQKAQLAKKNAKKLSRKQQKRKEKHIEKGVTTADSMAKKWVEKKKRVKVRAQTRNSDLGND